MAGTQGVDGEGEGERAYEARWNYFDQEKYY